MVLVDWKAQCVFFSLKCDCWRIQMVPDLGGQLVNRHRSEVWPISSNLASVNGLSHHSSPIRAELSQGLGDKKNLNLDSLFRCIKHSSELCSLRRSTAREKFDFWRKSSVNRSTILPYEARQAQAVERRGVSGEVWFSDTCSVDYQFMGWYHLLQTRKSSGQQDFWELLMYWGTLWFLVL